jgi:hypothetical protein
MCSNYTQNIVKTILGKCPIVLNPVLSLIITTIEIISFFKLTLYLYFSRCDIPEELEDKDEAIPEESKDEDEALLGATYKKTFKKQQ